jgi:hypothetical protein
MCLYERVVLGGSHLAGPRDRVVKGETSPTQSFKPALHTVGLVCDG